MKDPGARAGFKRDALRVPVPFTGARPGLSQDPEQHRSWRRAADRSAGQGSDGAVTQIISHLSLGQGFSVRKKGTPSAFLSADIEPPLFWKPPLPGVLWD